MIGWLSGQNDNNPLPFDVIYIRYVRFNSIVAEHYNVQ
jgi:hypothetical protein